MSGASSKVEEHVGESMAGRTNSSSFNPFVQALLVQLSKKAAASVRMLTADSERLFKFLGKKRERFAFGQCGVWFVKILEVHS